MSQARPLPRLRPEPIYTRILMTADANNPASPPRRRRRKRFMLAFLIIFLLPVFVGAGALAYRGGPTHWSDWDRTAVSHLPPAAQHPDAQILVMSGRTRGWKGVVAVHSWIVIKGENERAWRRYDVAGWGSPVRLNWWPPDLWFGEYGQVVVDISGPRAQALIPRVEAAIRSYQYPNEGDYRIWPGPNSNTFTASILRAIPEVAATLPPNAIGRDFRPWPYMGWTDSHTGVQASLWGLLGVKLGWVEGVEFNVLGLVAGLDLRDPGIKIPAFGHIGWPHATATAAARSTR
jgi:uncharacterized protein DUF3750